LQLAVQVINAGLTRGGAIPAGMDTVHSEAEHLKVGGLIFH
jgi:hypothetical protein